jgi:hypothetical protein
MTPEPEEFSIDADSVWDDLPAEFRLGPWIELSPADAVSAFGQPIDVRVSDGKISGAFIFKDRQGATLVLCDWKMTSLYDPSYPAPSDFWRERGSALMVGTVDDEQFDSRLKRFEMWLLLRARPCSDRPALK